MKTPIKTSQGTLTGEVVSKALLNLKFKPMIWPEVILKLSPWEAALTIEMLQDLIDEAAEKKVGK